MPSLRGRAQGELAIVLHTHMPYVEGFGTWPFGEEWLWEAMATSYLPLLELLERGAALTLSLTPVLCDQLEAPGVSGRFTSFVRDVRSYTHQEDIVGLRDGGHDGLADALSLSWNDYAQAVEGLQRRDGDLLRAFGPYAQWTSSATHAVLPLLATDAALAAQVRCGIRAHRARFRERWRGGFWLPECAFAPSLEDALAEAGVRATCVELTGRFGLGSRMHLQPLVGEAGVLLAPIDRQTIALVWSEQGYPAHGSYRDYHRHTVHHHNPWSNDGERYDHRRAMALAAEHAADFVARARARLREGEDLPGGGLLVVALDTELLGHWWYEGVAWLEGVVRQCAEQGLDLVRLDDALERHEPAPLAGAENWPVSTWGKGGDLSTWSGPAVAEMAFATRCAELEVLAARERASDLAVRELLALQASDWSFMVSRGLAVPYAIERFEGHRLGVGAALAAGKGGELPSVRNLAAHADRSLLFT
jgi:1,4-alpha-glucan branching enzyme